MIVISLMWCADYPHAHNWLYDEFSPTGGLNPGRLSVDPTVADHTYDPDDVPAPYRHFLRW